MEASQLIAALELQRHPEGGWYRETWRAPAPEGGRAGATAIYFLLEDGGRSHWHRVDATELWLWHAGAALTLRVAGSGAGPVAQFRLGPDIPAGQVPQLVIDPGAWQSAEADAGWALVSCVVSPGFEFSGFELAPEGWEPGLSAPGRRSA